MISSRRRTSGIPAAAPESVNGVAAVSLWQTAQLTYLTCRNLTRAKKSTLIVTAVVLALIAAAAAVLIDTTTAAFLASILLLLPVSMGAGIWVNTHPVTGWVRGLFCDTGVLLVRQSGDRWNITDHYACTPGHGSARPFRRRAFAELARQADQSNTIIITDTKVEKLKKAYLQDMPGLELDHTTTAADGQETFHLIRYPHTGRETGRG